MSTKPYLFLDVDGPLNPWRLITKKGYLAPKTPNGDQPYSYEKLLLRPSNWTDPLPLTLLLSKEMGADLLRLMEKYDFIAATAWEDNFNTHIAPHLGLPPIPVVHWPTDRSHYDLAHAGSWKTKSLLNWLDENGHRPWVFIDDEIRRADRELVRVHYGEDKGDDPVVPRWLLQIEPVHGLRRHDMRELTAWADRLATPAAA